MFRRQNSEKKIFSFFTRKFSNARKWSCFKKYRKIDKKQLLMIGQYSKLLQVQKYFTKNFYKSWINLRINAFENHEKLPKMSDFCRLNVIPKILIIFEKCVQNCSYIWKIQFIKITKIQKNIFPFRLIDTWFFQLHNIEWVLLLQSEHW